MAQATSPPSVESLNKITFNCNSHSYYLWIYVGEDSRSALYGRRGKKAASQLTETALRLAYLKPAPIFRLIAILQTDL
ncbi:hypothetical protein Q1W73_16760 [Asticcacaulis sp. ZE23SCel15]|uniref:hypothetical protein n=1 Tax=Asticcacaulis sp. ZE23SCel15 TaxID=3059027 RepID=UPI00265FBAE3|nr:hypothetical protein [Asticcacaulis sp. ZE23SCel15]WKL57293.1 hypothetical protein Q1W73_16760 [Asticcacaulis sp. ZE23SCel15]